MCCLQEVRWRGHIARMLGTRGRRDSNCSGKGDREGSMRVMVKEELCRTVVDVGRVSDRVITHVVVF